MIMICLGIESTAHSFGVGIVENKKVLANQYDMFKPPEGWGIKPPEAADHHIELKVFVINHKIK